MFVQRIGDSGEAVQQVGSRGDGDIGLRLPPLLQRRGLQHERLQRLLQVATALLVVNNNGDELVWQRTNGLPVIIARDSVLIAVIREHET